MTNPAYKTTWNQDIFLIEVGIPGPPGTGFTAIEATAVRNRLTVLEGRPNISTLESLTNVPDTGAVNGQSIIKTPGGWTYGNPSGALNSVSDASGSSVTNPTVLTTSLGLAVTEETSGIGKRAHISMQYGATGTANKAAREDHVHSGPIVVNQTIVYQGVLSTGSKIVQNTGLTGMDPDIIYDIEYTLNLDVIAAGVESNIGPRVRIGTGAYRGYDVRFKGHGKGITVTTYALGITGVTNYPLEARVYFNGGPQVELGAGQALAVASPRR